MLEPILDSNLQKIMDDKNPQSNGKTERWFGSYKGEFPLMNHPEVHDCMSWVRFYNYERIHHSLGYETPAHVYLGVKSI